MKKPKEHKPNQPDKMEPICQRDEKAEAVLADLQRKIEELTRQNEELLGKYQRLAADYANHEKRTLKRIEDDVSRQIRFLLLSLLPSLDQAQAAIVHMDTNPNGQSAEGLVEGVRLVCRHFLDALKVQGVEPIEAAGQAFDPSVHEAMMQRAEPDKPDGLVLEEYQKGYRWRGQLLRPSKVIVNKLPPVSPAASGEPKSESGPVAPPAAETGQE